MDLRAAIVLRVTNYLPFKGVIRLSTVDRATRALLYSRGFTGQRASIIAPETPGFLRTIQTRFSAGGDGTRIPYNDAHGRLHHIRLDFLVPFNAHDDVSVEASHGGFILYSTTPPRQERLNSDVPETELCICNPLNLYRTVLPRPNIPISLLITENRFALMFVNGVAPNIRYGIAFVSFKSPLDVRLIAYDSGNHRGWQQFNLLLRVEVGILANLIFQPLFVYKPRGERDRIWVLDPGAELVRVVRCPPGFTCLDVFIQRPNNRIIALGMVPHLQGREGSRFSFLELQLRCPPNLGWTAEPLAEQSARLNYQLGREPAYSTRWRIFRVRNLNSLLFRRRNRLALYNIDEGTWHRFQVPDAVGHFHRPEMYTDFCPP